MSKPHTNCRMSREQDSSVPSSLPGEPQLVRGEKVQSRRELITAVLRYATLGMLGAIGGVVFAKRRRLVQGPRLAVTQEGICINSGICRGCGIYEQCGLPRALSEKQLVTRIDDERK
ncbi:MAG TPA: hypothetical protein VMW72_18425 [Sedimentisphaerales bacterium]|nr:hypothetical protein [Sedimentisphaerales bacterium]